MAQRTLALLALLAVLTIGAFLLQDREHGAAPAEATSPAAPAEAEPTIALTAPEHAREPLGGAEALPTRPSAKSEPQAHPREKAKRTETLEAADAVLVFRALDVGGQPILGALSVNTEIDSRDGASSLGTRASTDGEGRFEVRIEPSLLEGDRRQVEVWAPTRTLTARVDLSRSFPPGRTEMGDLVLAPAPLIAEGRVIDAVGRPVAGATITAVSFDPGKDSDTGLEALPYIDEGTTPEDGAFAFYGSTNSPRMELRLRHKHLQAATLELPVGSRGIVIVAQEPGGVAGHVLADPQVPIRELPIFLGLESVSAKDRMESFDSYTMIADDGGFQIEGLLPGFYTLSIATIETAGIEIVPGEINRDPRLQALDLRGQLHAFTLDVVRPSRSFQLSGSVWYRESGTSTPVRHQFFSGSPVVVVTPLPAIDAIVQARGCRIERLSALPQRTEVRLRPLVRVRLVLPRDVVLPAPPLFLGAELAIANEGSEERALIGSEVRETPPFDEHGETVCNARDTGPMTVRWFLARRDKGGGSRGPLDVPFEQIVTVEDREGEQRIELAITQQALDAALSAR